MYELYYGTDIDSVRRKALARAHGLMETGVTVSHLDGDTFVPGALLDAVGATSLFGEAQGYVIDTPSSDKDFKAEVDAQLGAMAESTHTFIIIEGPLLAAEKKGYQKHATNIEEFKAAATERYNVFAMADSLSKKDKKQLWLQLQEARAAGLSAEEIIGTLWWQLKSLRLAALTKNATEAGMKDFPYSKAKRALAQFKEGELETLSASLLAVYHDGHGGVRDIDTALESWVLTM